MLYILEVLGIIALVNHSMTSLNFHSFLFCVFCLFGCLREGLTMLPWLVLNSGLKGFSHFSLANSWDYSSVPLCMAWCLWIKRSSSFWDRGTYQSFPLQLICFWTLFEFFFNLETMKKNLLQSKRLIVLPLIFKSNQSPSWIFWMTRGTNRVLHLIFLLSFLHIGHSPSSR